MIAAIAIQAGGGEFKLASAFDTEILILPAPVGGSMNTIRNGDDAAGSIANVLGGLKP